MADPTAQRVWDAALGQLQIHVTRPNYDTWLKDTRGLRIEDATLSEYEARLRHVELP